MKKTISAILCLTIIIVMAASVWAKEKYTVAVLPFSLHSADNIEYVRQGIGDMLSSRIAVADKIVVTRKEAAQEALKKSGAKEAMLIGKAFIKGRGVILAVMEPNFLMGSMGAVVVVSASVVLLPGISLVPVMVLTQVLNAVLLLPLLVFMLLAGRDEDLMGQLATGRRGTVAQVLVIVVVAVCVGALGLLAIT